MLTLYEIFTGDSTMDAMKKRTYDESWDLASIPQDVFRREFNRRSAAGRKGKSEQMRELAMRRWADKRSDKKSEK